MRNIIMSLTLISLSIQMNAQNTIPFPNQIITYQNPGSNGVFIPFSNELEAGERTCNIFVNFIDTWNPAAEGALNYAVGIWEKTLTSSVDITINARWTNMGNTSGILGAGGPATITEAFNSSHPAYADNVFYPSALANKLSGDDLNGNTNDINVTFNSAFSYWYFGTDGNTPSDKIDFVTLALQEIGHGLGFLTSAFADESQGRYGFTSEKIGPFPIINDLFIVSDNGIYLTDFPVGTLSKDLHTYLTTNDLFFEVGGGQNIKVHAPSVFDDDLSLSHFDAITYGQTENGLMTPGLSFGEAYHNPGPIGVAYLNTIGWDAVLVTGIEDNLKIHGFNYGCFSSQQCNYQYWSDLYSGPGDSELSEGETYYYSYEFIDNPPYNGENTSSFDWTLKALTNEGNHQTLSVCESSSCNLGLAFAVLHVENGSLEDLPYKRDDRNRIRAQVQVQGFDLDQFKHSAVKSVSIAYKPTNMKATLSSDSRTGCDEVSLEFYASGAEYYTINYSTQSSQNGSSILVPPGQNSYSIPNLDEGEIYTFTITAVNEFGSITSQTFTRNICAVNDPFPNPIEQMVTVYGPPSGIRSISVYSMIDNSLIQSKDFYDQPIQVQLDASNWPFGNYAIHIHGNLDNEIYSKKVTKL